MCSVTRLRIITALVGSCVITLASAGAAVSQDWLGSDFQEPLPQYQGSSSSEVVRQTRPQPVRTSPDRSVPDRAEELPSRVPATSGNLLAPNPLKSLLRGGAKPAEIPKPLPEKQVAPNPVPDKVRPPAKTPETIQPERVPPRQAEPKSVFRNRTQTEATPSKRAAKSVTAKKKQRTSVPKMPVVRYDIYRDTNTFPLDPRKPNNPCTRGANCGCKDCRLPGVKGKPFKPSEPGGYHCGKKCPHKRPQFSMFWPRPFSAKLDEAFPAKAAARYQPCQKKKLVDVFDCLTNFQLLDYQRVDNGYTGREADPYGCLGESKIFGLGFRPPGEPNNPAFSSVGYGYPIGN